MAACRRSLRAAVSPSRRMRARLTSTRTTRSTMFRGPLGSSKSAFCRASKCDRNSECCGAPVGRFTVLTLRGSIVLGMSDITEEDLLKRRVPARIAYLSPFRIVEKDGTSEPWSVTIEQVNKCSWDYVALHEVMGGVDVGLESPYHMVIA